jgi:hypothetical protein
MELSLGWVTGYGAGPCRRPARVIGALLGGVLLISSLLGCAPRAQQPTRAVPHRRSNLALSIDGTANGSYWSAAQQALFVSDSANGRILQWTEDHGFAVAAQLPPGGPSPAIPAELVVLGDGTLVVARAAHGKSDVLLLVPGSEPALVPGLDSKRRRVGLGLGPEGNVFASWIDKGPPAPRVGLSELSLGGGEQDIPNTLKMPADVLLRGDDLFVCDREIGAVLHAPRDAPEALAVFARIEAASWLAPGPGADLFAAANDGTVYRIDAAGTASVFDTGYVGVRGIAYDEQRRRLFVIAEQRTAAPGSDPGPAAEEPRPSTLYVSSVD